MSAYKLQKEGKVAPIFSTTRFYPMHQMKVSSQVKAQSALSLKEKAPTSCTLYVVVSRADVGTMEKKELFSAGDWTRSSKFDVQVTVHRDKFL